MSRKISIILLIIFILGMILAGFLMVKNSNQPNADKNTQSRKTKVVPIPIAPGNAIKPGIGIPVQRTNP